MTALLRTPPPPAGDKSAQKVSKQKRKGGNGKAGTERREAMSKRSKRIALILIGVAMALLAVAQYFGWIAGPPPLLAPGIQ
jgi:cell division septal protein FtsQ